MIVIIFNKVNHISVIAAAFAAAVMRRNYTAKVALVDIRDNIPDKAKAYLWLDSGSPLDLSHAAIVAGTINGLPTKLIHIEKSSEVIDSSTDDTGGWFNVSIAKLARKFFEENAITNEELVAMTQIAKGCLDFHKEDRAFTYYFGEGGETSIAQEIVIKAIDDIIKNARGYYSGECQDFLGIEAGQMFSPLYENDYHGIKDLSIENPAILSHMVDNATISGVRAKLITSTDPQVYALLRRLAITKQSFVHVSTGMNGMVIYSNEVVPENASISNIQAFINLGFKV